jgi:hypothetical protein
MIHVEVFWVVAPCSVVRYQLSDVHAASIFRVKCSICSLRYDDRYLV